MEEDRDIKKIRHMNLLAEIASMYYEQDMTQSEIASAFCISRSRISRLLQMAKDNGIIDIKIHRIGERAYELERILKNKYHLKEAIVFNNENFDSDEVRMHMGQLAAKYLEAQMQDGQTIGISWGRSLAQVVDALQDRPTLKLEIVQLMGGTMTENKSIDISELLHKMGNKYDSIEFRLNAPLYIADDITREALKKQPIVENTLNKAKKAEIIITGIGNVSKDTFSFMWTGYDNEDELQKLEESAAVGFIFAQAYDIDGKEIKNGFNQRIIGIKLHELNKIKTVLGISGGKQKAKAVLGALKGGYINVLVTDRSCVKEMIKLEKEERQTITTCKN